MKVKAVTDGNLLIACNANTAPEDSAFLISASANMTEAAALKPASTVDLVKWATTSAASRTAKAAQSSQRNDISANTNGYVLKPNSFWLLSENPTYAYLSGLSIKQNGTPVVLGWNGSNASYFFNSLRIGIKCGSEWYIYAPSIHSGAGNNSVTPDTSFVGDKYDGGSWQISTISKAEDITATTNVGTAANHYGIVASNVKAIMEVYIWFEGEDGACYTNNIVLDDVEIAIELKSASLTQSEQLGGENYYQIGSTSFYVKSSSATSGADIYTIDGDNAIKSALYVYGGES